MRSNRKRKKGRKFPALSFFISAVVNALAHLTNGGDASGGDANGGASDGANGDASDRDDASVLLPA